MRSIASSWALLVASALVAGCGQPTVRESGAAACTNGLDDDHDGLTDCEESSCAGVLPCPSATDGGGDGPDGGVGPVDASLWDATPIECFDPIDLVFVLDVSTSMAMEASRLRTGVESIFAAADALTHDLRFGLVVFVDDALVVSSCAPFATADSLRAELQHWQDFCASNESPTSGEQNADCAENSLDAIYAAATTCTWREDATHVLIHVTDDTFEEPPYVYSDPIIFPGGVPAVHRYSEVVAALVASEIRVGAFAMETPEACGAGTSDDTGRGFFTPFEGMPSLPEATHGRVWDLADVRGGSLDMATAINEMIEDSYCEVF